MCKALKQNFSEIFPKVIKKKFMNYFKKHMKSRIVIFKITAYSRGSQQKNR